MGYKKVATKKKTGPKPKPKRTALAKGAPRYLVDGKSKGDFGMIMKRAPFAPSMNVCLEYGDNIILTAGTTGVYGTETIFNLNSLYSPQYSGGHQPYGRDSLALLYRRYVVHAVGIDLTYTDPSEDGMIIACILQGADGTFAITGSNNNAIAEKPMTVVRTINNSGEQTGHIKHFTHLHKLEGIHKYQWNANLADYSAGVGATPSKTPYLRIACASARNTSGATIMLRPLIKFYCTFYERIVLAQS